MATDFVKNRELVQTLVCPKCKAKKGEACRTTSGRSQYANHPARISVAFRKGIIK